jgi:predicted Zn-dependent protease
MIVEWRGYYLDGQSAKRRPATIQITQIGLQFKVEDGPAQLWLYEEIRQTQGFYAGEQVRFERAGGDFMEALLLSDVEFLSTLHRLVPGLGQRFHEPKRRGLRASLTIFAAVAVIAIGGALYLWGIPGLAALVAARVPVAWEEKLGQSVVAQFAPPELRCDDATVEKLLNEIGARLAQAAPESPYKIRVYVAAAPMVNAFAAPGGHIVVFQGLIEESGSPDELAGVLAHELQHVLKRHSTRMLVQHASTGLIISALTGDVSGAIAFGLEAARTLGALSYSRAMEEEADAEGLKMMAATGFNPAGMIAFFDTMQKRSGEIPQFLTYFSTHPNTEDRIEKLRRLAAEAKPVKSKPFQKYDWNDIKKRCRTADRGQKS